MADVVIIAGNGPSLERADPVQVKAGDRIVRINNFFFEPVFHLGPRVDLAVMGGDPRVAPFMLESLSRARHSYDIAGWTGFDARVVRAGRRLALPFAPPLPWPAGLEAGIAGLTARYQLKPTTGTRAAVQGWLMAEAAGLAGAVLLGFDLYGGPAPYSFAPGRHFRALMAHDLGRRDGRTGQHDPDLDRAVLGLLAEHAARTGGPALWRGVAGTALDGVLDAAPEREGPTAEGVGRPRPDAETDWPERVGAYPILLLRVLRRVRALTLRKNP